MKKTLLLASVAALSLTQASAQQSLDRLLGRHHQPRQRNAGLTARLLQSQASPSTGLKPTATKQRVIAQAVNPAINDGDTDSTHYNYTGTNGSHYSYNAEALNYSQYFSSIYAPMFQLPYLPASQDLLADSITLYDNEGVTERQKAYYRADKKIDSTIQRFTSGAPTAKTINVYNPQGYLTTSYGLQQAGATWDTISIKKVSYNSGFTQVESDSLWFGFSSLALRERNVYYYSAGKLDSFITWDLQGSAPVREQGYYIAYTSAGKISTIKNFDFDPTTGEPHPYSIDSLGYTTGVADFTLYDNKIFDADTLNYTDRQELFRNAAGLVDSVKYYASEGLAPLDMQIKVRFTYNSYNNPEALIAKVAILPQEIVAYRFYYETYEDQPNGVRPLAANQDFAVYPNPFGNTLSIDWKGKQNTVATVRLVNIMGQEVYNSPMQLKTGTNKLNVPQLTSGSYVLLISDTDGKSWSSKLVKQ